MPDMVIAGGWWADMSCAKPISMAVSRGAGLRNQPREHVDSLTTSTPFAECQVLSRTFPSFLVCKGCISPVQRDFCAGFDSRQLHQGRPRPEVIISGLGLSSSIARSSGSEGRLHSPAPYWAPAVATPRGRPRRTQINHRYAATPTEASKAIMPSSRAAFMQRMIVTRIAPTMLSTRATRRPSR